ncbi:hypothetical protein N9821_01110 [Akkermansiaceae bacterium]|nr:hypothetical protein [Akkermansiaceae bacterium]MDB4259728.1 hypothetical protein [Akkermansiaceae bacterium]MDB4388365.1 hypothetical protein [Akkermansiaceae bacterium]
MNPHLRFQISSAALAAGVLFSLCSCSTTKIQPLKADPQHEITYEITIFDAPKSDTAEGTHSGLVGIVSQEAGEMIISQLKGKPTFSSTTGGRLGQTKKLSNRKDYTYPTEYDPPEMKKAVQGAIFPVTPAKPKNFKTTKLGTDISLRGSKSPSGKVNLDVEIDRKVLLRLVNYGTPITSDATDFWGHPVNIVITENRIEVPEFGESTIKSSINFEEANSINFEEGNYLIIRSSHPDAPSDHGKPTTEFRSADFIAFIRVATSKP